MANNGEEGMPRLRDANGLSDIFDGRPAEERIRLLQDSRDPDEALDSRLEIFSPSSTNLINIATNEMWKFGLIPRANGS